MKKSSTAPPRPSRFARPFLESLERRELLTATPGPALLFQLNPGDPGPALLTPNAGDEFAVEGTAVSGLYRVTGTPEALASLEALYRGNGALRYVEYEETFEVQLAPNDPSYTGGSLYGLSGTWGIKAPLAWDTTTGSTTVVVADIDTGVDYTHPDLYKNIWINQTEIPTAIKAALTDTDGDGLITFWDLNNAVNIGPGKITDLNGNGYIDGGDILKTTAQGGWADGADGVGGSTANGFVDDLIGWNFASNNNNPMDVHGHGTHTAGTVAAVGNNGTGVVGVAWKAQIMIVKSLSDSGSGSSTALAAGINYSANNGAKISNNSWGGGGANQTTFNAILNAQAKGQLFVAAAGNNGGNNDTTPFYPASYDTYNGQTVTNVVSVAASTSSGTRASFSNYGATKVDLAAPGNNTYSTYPVAKGSYATLSGTSMAAPHVSGVAVLMLSANPNLTFAQLKSQLIAASTTTPSPSTWNGVVVSGGILNANLAVQGNANAAPVLATIPDQTITGSSVTVTLSASDANGDPLTYSAQPFSAAYHLDQKLGFFSDGNLYQNYGGKNEKWFQGGGGLWYFIEPTGVVRQWDGVPSTANGAYVATLATSFYATPSALYNAVNGPANVTATVSGNQLTLTPNAGFTGSFAVSVTVSDGKGGTDTKTFLVNPPAPAQNAPPVLAAIADRSVAKGTSQTVTLSASDPNGDALTYTAKTSTLAWYLDQKLGFFSDGNLYQNYGGKNEKWFQGAGGLWYFIEPTGVVRQWDGVPNTANGALIATLPTSFYADPSALYNAVYAAAPTAQGTVSVTGTTLTITVPAAATGEFGVEVTVSDGKGGTDVKLFKVTIT